MKKALLIDSERRKIVDIEIRDFEDINRAIGSDIFTTAYQFENGDTIYVDDEGLLKPQGFGFQIKGSCQDLFVGNGVVLGGDNHTGESRDVKSDLLDIAHSITFIRLK